MIRKLQLHVNNVSTLFVNVREGFSTLAKAINLLNDKLDEVIGSHNKVLARIDDIESVLPRKGPVDDL